MKNSIRAKASNVMIDMLTLLRLLIGVVVLTAYTWAPIWMVIYLIFGSYIKSLIAAGILTCLISWIIAYAKSNDTYNPMKWWTNWLGHQVDMDGDYFYEHIDEMTEWLSDNMSSSVYFVQQYGAPHVVMRNHRITYVGRCYIKFLRMRDAVEFKIIFTGMS